MGARDLKGYNDTLNDLVVALCRDFERRERRTDNRRVAMEHKYINTKMLEAAGEVVGGRYAEIIIREIGERIGYAASQMEDLSESTYKRKKTEVKRAIARKLYLSE